MINPKHKHHKIFHIYQLQVIDKYEINGTIVYVGREELLLPNGLYYLNDQFRFIEGLPELLKNKLTVRLMPYDWGWDQFDRWNDKYFEYILNNSFTNNLLKKLSGD